ncbi:MAG TPA: YciI family protein [Gemmatimonadales bacterium]|nr:YciI family protein [Gemmatimonadales bacterium]
MRVLVISKAPRKTDEQPLPIKVGDNAAAFEAMGKYIQAMTEAGVMVQAEGLKPSRFAKRVRADGSKRTVTDGPFTETKEVIASYTLLEVKSLDEALEWIKRVPDPHDGPMEYELRPVLDPSDFDFGGAMPAQEEEEWKKMSGRDR